MSLDNLKINQRSYYNLPNLAFWGWLSMESQPQNPEFRINPENFHPWINETRLSKFHNIIWSHLSYKTRGHVYSSCVGSAMLHASET